MWTYFEIIVRRPVSCLRSVESAVSQVYILMWFMIADRDRHYCNDGSHRRDVSIFYLYVVHKRSSLISRQILWCLIIARFVYSF